VHFPGTVLNDQYQGDDPWEANLALLEARTPVIEAIGVSDYYSLDTYERLGASKDAGRLPHCGLIFPNVEMRLAFGTVKGQWVNVHLLISPERNDHVAEARRFLGRLTFDAYEDTFACTPADLIRLGKAAGAAGDDRAALEFGSQQFKVSFDQLRENYRKTAWARENTLIVVAGGDDGAGGLRDGSDATTRQEVLRLAHAVFASSPAQREFWLGQRAAGVDELWEMYGGPKPCLHGSDGHDLSRSGVPDGDRFSWVKGDPTFDALRQACIDPASRAFVGPTPPVSAMASQVITEVTIHGADWAATPKLALNPGLVAVIGARGSGKTALADIIAAGCDALPETTNTQSFLHRARELLGDTSVTLTWGEGDRSERSLLDDGDWFDRSPRARYLSQQFVDELCSSTGMTDALLKEIERVVFDSHGVSDRDGAVNFDDLLDLRATRHRQARTREEGALATVSERIGTELEKVKLVDGYKAQIAEKSRVIAQCKTDRHKLVSKGSEARVARLQALTEAAEKVRNNVRHFNLQTQQLLTLQDEVKDVRTNWAPEDLRKTAETHAAAGIRGDDWKPFQMDYKGEVDQILADRLQKAQTSGASWKGKMPPPEPDLETAYLADDAELERQPLAILEAEINRLQQLVNVDKTTTQKFAALSKKIVDETELLARLQEKLTDAEGAKSRADDLQAEREAIYRRVFEAIAAEEGVLSDLYAPIKARLAGAEGTLSKLAFSVTRTADAAAWAQRGEDELVDLRRQGPFKGKGALQQIAEQDLKPAWETGDPEAVSAAMTAFRKAYVGDLLEHARVSKADQAEYRAWLKRFAQWLYSTDHISIRYSVDYDGVDIRKLSPGTRGIVLLLLYLALDDADDRPLIIDQPEENLDPKSIFDELVALFLKAKAKRQVIMVTHNANLVINTDADQIIVATAGTHAAGRLPPMTYTSGGLEDASIRRSVCDILEGGERAFKERARRLRVRLQR
jgi:energy-coupling factor transporter ATP-binding protein EcfA2